MWLLIIPAVLLLFIAIILIRAIAFKPKKKEEKIIDSVFVNGDSATNGLSRMIKCKTISHIDPSLDDKSEFERFEKLLPELFPLVFEKCSYEKVGDRGILIRWRGKSAGHR